MLSWIFISRLFSSLKITGEDRSCQARNFEPMDCNLFSIERFLVSHKFDRKIEHPQVLLFISTSSSRQTSFLRSQKKNAYSFLLSNLEHIDWKLLDLGSINSLCFFKIPQLDLSVRCLSTYNFVARRILLSRSKTKTRNFSSKHPPTAPLRVSLFTRPVPLDRNFQKFQLRTVLLESQSDPSKKLLFATL